MKKHKKNRRRLENQWNIGTKKNWRDMNKCNGKFNDSFKTMAYFFVTIILTAGLFLLAISVLKNRIPMELYIKKTSEISKLQWVFDLISAVVLVWSICRIFPVLKDPSHKFQSLNDFYDSKENLLTWPIIFYICLIYILRPINSPGMLCGYLIINGCMFPIVNKLVETVSDPEYNSCNSFNDVESEHRENVVFALLVISFILLILGTIQAFPIP